MPLTDEDRPPNSQSSLASQTEVTQEACGKAIIIGEHFVVWGGTALAFPVRPARVSVTVSARLSTRNSTHMAKALDSDDRRLVEATRKAVTTLCRPQRYSVDVSTSSNFPISSGLGGSAAYSVALCRCLHKLETGEDDDDLVAQTALDLERVFHRYPSGIDSTTVAFNTPCYVKTGAGFSLKPHVSFKGPRAGFIDIPPGATFVLAWSGQAGDTRTAIMKVREFASGPQGAQVLRRLTEVNESMALQAASALRRGDFAFVGLMMNENHLLLRSIGVSNDSIDTLTDVARRAGALGAKLTGGGLGGFVLSLCTPDRTDRLVAALRRAGSTLVFVQNTSDFTE